MPGKQSTSRNAWDSVNLHKPSSGGKDGLDLTHQLTEVEPTLLLGSLLLHRSLSTGACPPRFSARNIAVRRIL